MCFLRCCVACPHIASRDEINRFLCIALAVGSRFHVRDESRLDVGLALGSAFSVNAIAARSRSGRQLLGETGSNSSACE